MMKLSTSAVALLLCLSGASAFAPVYHHPTTKHDLVCLEMSSNRRQILQQTAAAAAGVMIASFLPPFPANAAEPRPTYLTEPTDEFKANEQKAMEFRRAQLDIKQKFTSILDRLTSSSKTEEELVKDLNELRNLVVSTEGLPVGLKKDDLVKQVRSKKAKGFWPTNVEIAYQGLISEINFQQSPNTEKDMGNPL